MPTCARTLTAALPLLAATLAILAASPANASPATDDGQHVIAPSNTAQTAHWWQHAVIYEIYPRSFQDSNADGVGDLTGITQRLDYLQSLGVDAIWVTPFFPSPNRDFGYDVANYTAIDPQFGTMADWDRLVAEARRRHIRVLVDFVVNHSSDQHRWFRQSRQSRTNDRADWYVWRDGTPDHPPTNWRSIFGGSAWTWDLRRRQWYYHIFLPQQPDLNWRNPAVQRAMLGVMRFWLDRGASGFRLDATPYLFEDASWPQDPDPDNGAPTWLKPYNAQQPEGNAILRDMRRLVDSYRGDPILLGESATSNIAELRAVYGANRDEIHLPMNFLVGNLSRLDAAEFKRRYDEAATRLDGLPPVSFFSSHDQPRQWSEFGNGRDNDRIAKLTAALTLLTPGTSLLYYGEEIGMADADPVALAATPLGPRRPVADARDKVRSPMQWSAAANAGFSSATPWLPVPVAVGTYRVDAQQDDPQSILNWYRTLIALRRNDPAFANGGYWPLDSGNPGIFAFARHDGSGHAALVLVNCTSRMQTATVAGLPDGISIGTQLLAASASIDPARPFDVPAYGVTVLRLDVRR